MPRMAFPSKESRETYVALAQTLEQFGITQYQPENGGKHPCIVFKAGDQTFRYPYPSTSSNRHSLKYVRSNLVNKLKGMGMQPLMPTSEDHEEPIQAAEPFDTEAFEPLPSERETPLEGVQQPQQPRMPDREPQQPRMPDREPQQPQMPEREPQIPRMPEREPQQPRMPEREPQQPQEPELVDEPELASWDEDTLVHYAKKHLLYVPLPQDPVLVFELDRELMGEPGDKLVINPNSGTLRILSKRQLEASHRLAEENTTNLRQAIHKLIGPKPQAKAAPPPPPPPPPPRREQVVEEEPRRMTKARIKGVGMQMGRVLVAMNFLHQHLRSDKIDTASLAEVMSPLDKTSLASQVSFATNKRYVYVVGPIPGRRGNYYRLTESGKKKARELGDEPFIKAGMRPPSMAMAAE